ncbi:MAG: endonuclease III [Planctomycetota bacterium]|jgi:endonuclease-3
MSEAVIHTESQDERRQRARKILQSLRRQYRDADCALIHDSALQLLIATILSAQSTDETVNKVTPVLFERYPTARSLANAPREDVERIIHSTGFFRQKAKSIQGACAKLLEDFDGQVPETMESLVTLPGVARKTANVVLGTWFGKNAGVVVDTHVGRIASRLALTWTSKNTKDAVKIEQDLMALMPRRSWTFLSHAMILHGRQVCSARKPSCGECKLLRLCPSAVQFIEEG